MPRGRPPKRKRNISGLRNQLKAPQIQEVAALAEAPSKIVSKPAEYDDSDKEGLTGVALQGSGHEVEEHEKNDEVELVVRDEKRSDDEKLEENAAKYRDTTSTGEDYDEDWEPPSLTAEK
ncbi:hypothetical protein GYMLUDRAFT_91117 [Collybiopsis luxurians FD-317 M1]|nr:hypothetical protein GYMLUDRAFT_91117 [Collybiopsis luxurians FD-317 M1]